MLGAMRLKHRARDAAYRADLYVHDPQTPTNTLKLAAVPDGIRNRRRLLGRVTV